MVAIYGSHISELDYSVPPGISEYKGKGNIIFILTETQTAIALGKLQFFIIAPLNYYPRTMLRIETVRSEIINGRCKDLNTLASLTGTDLTWRYAKRSWLW